MPKSDIIAMIFGIIVAVLAVGSMAVATLIGLGIL